MSEPSDDSDFVLMEPQGPLARATGWLTLICTLLAGFLTALWSRTTGWLTLGCTLLAGFMTQLWSRVHHKWSCRTLFILGSFMVLLGVTLFLDTLNHFGYGASGFLAIGGALCTLALVITLSMTGWFVGWAQRQIPRTPGTYGVERFVIISIGLVLGRVGDLTRVAGVFYLYAMVGGWMCLVCVTPVPFDYGVFGALLGTTVARVCTWETHFPYVWTLLAAIFSSLLAYFAASFDDGRDRRGTAAEGLHESLVDG